MTVEDLRARARALYTEYYTYPVDGLDSKYRYLELVERFTGVPEDQADESQLIALITALREVVTSRAEADRIINEFDRVIWPERDNGARPWSPF